MVSLPLSLLSLLGLPLVSSTWTQLPDAGWSPRSAFRMVVSGDDVIVAGGTDDPSRFFNDAYRMNLSDGSWYPLPFATPQWGARASFGMSALKNGTIVLTGGQQEDGGHASFQDVWALDALKWRQLPDAPWRRRVGHAQSTCRGADGSDRIIISGGASTDAGIFISVYNDVWSMSLDGRWTQLANVPWKKRFLHATTCLSDGSLVLTGGHSGFQDFNDVWLMSSSGQWNQLVDAAPFSKRSRFGMVTFPDDSVLAGEGMSKEDFWFTEDIRNGSWQSLGRPPFSERYDYGMVALPKGDAVNGRSALIAGGTLLENGIHNYNNVYRLDIGAGHDITIV